jgi:hypothetical protein
MTIISAMVRIRLPSGNLREFVGSDELAQAIAAGEVGRDAEIYHAKSGRWVSITGHPVFRRARIETPPPPEPKRPLPEQVSEGQNPPPPQVQAAEIVPESKPEEAAAPEPTAAVVPPLRQQELLPADVAPPPSSPGPPPQARSSVVPPTAGTRHGTHTPRGAGITSPAHAPPPVLEMQSKSGQELAARRRAPWRLPAAVVLVMAALACLFWIYQEREHEAPVPATRPTAVARRPVNQPPVIVSRDTTPSPAPVATAPATAVEPLVLAENHARLSDSLDSELARAARQSGLIGFLETARLASDDSVQASRAALIRFVASLATYRARQQELSKVYNDSADALVLSGAWDRGALREWQVRVRRPEPPAVVARADALIAGLDSVLGLLHEHRGGYDITADQIRFKAPRASLQYDELLRGVNSNRVSQSEQISAPLNVLAEAIAGRRLPPSAHD